MVAVVRKVTDQEVLQKPENSRVDSYHRAAMYVKNSIGSEIQANRKRYPGLQW